MRDFLDDSWNIFNAKARGKKIVLFGLNSAIKLLESMRKFGRPWDVCAIIDNDKNKSGIVDLDGEEYPVYTPEAITSKIEEKFIVLICGTYTIEMAEQLESLGIQDYYSELWMNYPDELKKNIVPQSIDMNKIEIVKMLLSDTDSSWTLNEVVEKRKKGVIDYTDIMYRGKSEYFIDDYWRPEWDGAIIDGGAYNGDTIEEIDFVTKGRFKKIYSFEPQQNLANIIKKDILWRYGDRVEFFNKGLWSSSAELYFENGDNSVSGRIDAQATNVIITCSLDEVVDEKVSFIKMDIEGAEVEALKGAGRIIKRDKPCMAICIYHKPSHLWEIPILIHEMVPEYKFFVKHCGVSMYGTILYAKI